MQGSVIGPLLYLLFMNDLPDILELQTLLFADDVKKATRRTQNMNLHSSRTTAWDLSINPTKCKCLTIWREVPLRLSFYPDESSRTISVSKYFKDLGVQTGNVFSPSAHGSEAANKTKRLIIPVRRSFQGL